MADPFVLLDRPADNVARLLINRPDKRNAIDFAVREQLARHIRQIHADPGTRALVLGGVGGMFSAGGDLPSMLGLDQDQARARMQHVQMLCRLVGTLPIPVVSAMEGIAAGAAVGLALLGDFIIASPDTRILFPFLNLGLVPDWGQVLTLPRRVGIGPARRILTSGEAVGGEEALRVGLVDTLVAADQVMAAAIGRAAALARLPMEAFARMKRRLNQPSDSLVEELAREETDQAVCLLSDDFDEGYAAFRDKRKPNFVLAPAAP